jgi:hypothetical protein
MQLPAVRVEIEHKRRQIHRRRREIRDLQRAGISTFSAEELLVRMLTKVDDLCAERDRLVGEGRRKYPGTRLITNTRGNPLYYLIWAGPHPKGLDGANHILGKSKTPKPRRGS